MAIKIKPLNNGKCVFFWVRNTHLSFLSNNYCSLTKSRLNLCDPMDCSNPVFPVFTISWRLFQLMFIESVMPTNHLIFSCPPLPHPQSFLASGSFPVSRFFTSGGQSIGVSASVLPMNIQGWFPLGLTDLILLSKGFSRVCIIFKLKLRAMKLISYKSY